MEGEVPRLRAVQAPPTLEEAMNTDLSQPDVKTADVVDRPWHPQETCGGASRHLVAKRKIAQSKRICAS